MTKVRIFHILAAVCRALGAVWLLLAAAVALYAGASRLALVNITNVASALEPAPWQGLLVFALPSGGSIRGDFLITAAVFFVLGQLFSSLAKRARMAS